MVRPGLLLVFAALLAGPTGAPAPATQAQTLSAIADYPLGGDTSRYDYQSFDATSNRLYIAHLGAGVLRVFDTQAHTVVGTVGGLPGIHGVIAVPETGTVYATATSAHAIAAIDAATLSITAMIPAGDFPDGLAYAPTVGKLYVSDLRGGNDIVIDALSNTIVTTIPLGGEVGNTQFDTTSGHIFVAAQGATQVAEIDPATDTIVGRYETPGCVDPHGLAVDASRQLAFVACEGNDRLLIMDMQTKSFTNSYATGHTPDVLAFEPQQGTLYVAAEDGVLSGFHVDGAVRGQLDLVIQSLVGPNAHSVAVDTNTGHIFLPTVDPQGVPVLREMVVEN